MGRFLLSRLTSTLLVVWGTATLMFVLIRTAPGDPAVLLSGPTATAAQVADARDLLGLNEPLWQQYLSFLGDLLRLDFGYSIRLGADAMELALERLPATAELAFAATILGVAVGVPAGIAAGRRPGSLVDRVVTTTGLTIQALPAFWVGIMLILVVSRQLNWLPSSGRGEPQQLVLPAVTLAAHFVGFIARLTRSGMAGVIEEPFMRAARAKGISENAVVYGHGVRNMLIPVVTVIGLQMATLLSGAVIIETVFAWPGIGQLLIDSVSNRDYAVAQAVVVIMALITALVNVVVDVIYAWIDPRISVVRRA